MGAELVPRRQRRALRAPATTEAASAAGLGFIAGGVLGAAAGFGLLLVLGGADRVARGWGLGVRCATHGAVLGLVLSPVAKALILPDEPLRRATWWTFAGALAGVVVGCVVGPQLGVALAWPAGLGRAGPRAMTSVTSIR